MTDIHWFYPTAIVLFFYIGAVFSVVRAIRTSRTPQGAMAWSIALISMPFIALPAYWIFGRSKFHGYVEQLRSVGEEVRQEMRAIIERLARYGAHGPTNLAPLFRVIENATRFPFMRGNTVELLIDGEHTYDRMLEAIAQAEEYIVFQFYIFRNDGIGNRFANALAEKAKSGVAVYFLYDEIGCAGIKRAFLKTLSDSGIVVSGFKTTKGRGNRFQVNFRNHRKLVIVDGHTAFVGGLNVGDDYLGLNPKVGPWRDTHLKIEGPAVIAAQATFAGDWYWATDQIPDLKWSPASAEGAATITVVSTGPADVSTLATLYHVEAFNAANQRVWIANPYFVPDEPTAKALELAARRGVDVRVIVPANNDNQVVQLASMNYIASLQAAGVRFYQYKQGERGFLHQKVFLIDDSLGAVGTTNLDNRSLHVNFECTALIANPRFVGELALMFEEDLNHSTELAADFLSSRSHGYRFFVKAANLAAPML